MKRIIICLLCAFSFCGKVNADTGCGSNITSYEVIVTNTNGAPTYNYKGLERPEIYQHNKKLTIVMEIMVDGELYLGVDTFPDYINNYSCYDNDDDSYFVKSSDVKIISEIDFDKLNQDVMELYVLFEGAKLYEGPSIKYDIVEDVNIPVGTTLLSKYRDGYWDYVEYDGKKGWVLTNENYNYKNMEPVVTYVDDTPVIMFVDQIDIYQNPDFSSTKQTITIGRNSIATQSMTYKDFRYIKTEQYGGWIYWDWEKMPYNSQRTGNVYRKVLAPYSIKITKYIDSDEIIDIIPQGEKLELKSEYFAHDDNNYVRHYYIEYKGKHGWISMDDLARGSTTNHIALMDIDVYNDVFLKVKEGTIKKNQNIDTHYTFDHTLYNRLGETYHYLETENIKGWIDDKTFDKYVGYSPECSQYLILEKNGITVTDDNNNTKVIPYYGLIKIIVTNEYNGIEYNKVEYENKKYNLEINLKSENTSDIELAKSYRETLKVTNLKNDKYVLKVYDSHDLFNENNVIFTIPNNEKFEILFESNKGYFINYNGNKGWITRDDRWHYTEILDIFSKESCLVDDLFVEKYGEIKPGLFKDSIWKEKRAISTVVAAVALIFFASIILVIIRKQKKLNNNVE